MDLKPQFAEFLAAIRPTERQKEDWRTGSTTLRTRLENDLTLSPLVVATFLQGSVRRSTAIRPAGDKRPDVDVVVVTTIDYEHTSPQEAMELFVPFLEKHYPGKWRWQGRSFGIELSYVDLDLVITALPADKESRAFMDRLYRSQAVMTNETLEDDSSWRLNENWRPDPFGTRGQVLTDAPQSEWRPHPLLLPDRDVGEWGRTHPLAQIAWTATKNRNCSGHYVNLVRAMKCWKQEHTEKLPKYPKGYPLEHMIGYALEDGTISMARGLEQFLEKMRDMWHVAALTGQVPVLSDHGVPEHNVLKRLSSEDFKAFHAAITEAARKAREALECEDATESGELWQELFGSKFPLPGPQGGDRTPSGFVPPTRPAEPQKTGRFA